MTDTTQFNPEDGLTLPSKNSEKMIYLETQLIKSYRNERGQSAHFVEPPLLYRLRFPARLMPA